MEEIFESGIIEAVLFKNDDNGYAVLKLRTEDGGELVAVGCVPFPGVGEYVEISGTASIHPTYGEQVKITSITRSLPTSADMILEYLSSGAIRGIGRKTAEKIIETFGDESLYIIERKPKRLCEIAGITAKKAEQISKQFELTFAMTLLMEFVVENGLKPEIAVALVHNYGIKATEIVKNNPYILTSAGVGVPFYQADKLAIDMGFEANARERLSAAVLYELRFNSESGHTFIPYDKLCAATSRLVSVEYEEIEETISRLEREGEIVVEEICNLKACYLSELYDNELFAAKRFALLALKNEATDFPCNDLIMRIQRQENIVFEPMQMKAIEMAMNNSVLLLTGGPGTGKTTVIKGILSAFEKMNLRVLLAAPTGRAAKKMSEFCGVEAKTIHRLLEICYSDGMTEASFGFDEHNPLPAEALIIDESSMVDISLMSAVLKAMPKKCKLVLVGDADQLPSVGPGNVFKDLLASEKFPAVRLEKIFRQAAESDIIVGAHSVNKGEMPDLKKKDNDLFFMQRTDENDMVNTVLELCSSRLPKNMNIPSVNIQVLSPGRKGQAGTEELNRKLQQVLNPPCEGKDERRFAETVFRVGDRVMQVKNNYTINWYGMYGGEVGYGVFNGDIGEIISIDSRDETLTVSFDSRLVHYPFSMLHELELAYAMTVHKAQGSEFSAVVLLVNNASPALLHRSVLYTAMTRARELLVMVGDVSAFKQMLANNKQRNRYSALKTRIIGLLS